MISMATTTVNYLIARVVNIPGVFHLDEIVVPDTIQLPIFGTSPDGKLIVQQFTNPMPLAQALAQAPQYINHEGDPATVHLHHIDGTVSQVTLSSLHIPSTPVKRIRIPPSEHSKRFTIEVGLQVTMA